MVQEIFPFPALLILAALQEIPKSLYEAAMIDSAGVFNRFRHITLPAITPTMLSLFIILTMWAFRSFPFFYALTRGGPGDATLVFEYLAYRVAFRWHDIGYGSALSYYMVILTSIAAYFYLRLLGRRGMV